MTAKELVMHARRARENAYAPYSDFAVGAALLAADGRIFLGCNIENAAFTPTVCAERVALFSAVAAGVREFSAIAVVGGKSGADPDSPCTPCGVCRQALAEFCSQALPVYTANGEEIISYTLGALLPHAFIPENLA